MEKYKIFIIVGSIILIYFAIDLISSFSSSEETLPVISQGNEKNQTLTNSFSSGGIGLSQTDWEQIHTRTGKDILGSIYDKKYIVMFHNGNINYIERQWETENAVASDVVMTESKGLIPSDSQHVKTYSPEGVSETIVHLYYSESLKSRFNVNSESSSVWTGGESGNFTVQYNQYEYGISRMIITIGNNP